MYTDNAARILKETCEQLKQRHERELAALRAQHERDVIARLDELLQRLAESGDGKSLADAYAGVWRAGQSYVRGNVVTHSGSAWLALSDTSGERPGEAPMWRMIVKRGRNARDAA